MRWSDIQYLGWLGLVATVVAGMAALLTGCAATVSRYATCENAQLVRKAAEKTIETIDNICPMP